MKIDVKKAVPGILTGTAVVGLGASVGLTVLCHDKALPEIVKLKEENPEIKKTEIAKHVWKYYIPVILSTGVTATCIILSNHISAAQLAAMTASATAALKQRDKLKAKVKEVIGEDKWHAIEKALGDESVRETISAGECEPDEVIFYDAFTNEAFYAKPEIVKEAREKLNRIMAIEASASLADFYELMGKKAPWYANDYGWSFDYGVGEGLYCWIDIELEELGDDNNKYYKIAYTTEPSTAYEIDEYKTPSKSAIERANQVQTM